MAPTASRPSSSSFQKASGLSAPPGKRQAIPTTAMGSVPASLGLGAGSVDSAAAPGASCRAAWAMVGWS